MKGAKNEIFTLRIVFRKGIYIKCWKFYQCDRVPLTLIKLKFNWTWAWHNFSISLFWIFSFWITHFFLRLPGQDARKPRIISRSDLGTLGPCIYHHLKPIFFTTFFHLNGEGWWVDPDPLWKIQLFFGKPSHSWDDSCSFHRFSHVMTPGHCTDLFAAYAGSCLSCLF